MNVSLTPLLLVIGLVLSPIAALMSYFITYDEYLHHYPDKGTPRRMALQAAALTFIFFVLISMAVGWVLGMVLQ
jgi:hypothetical protein